MRIAGLQVDIYSMHVHVHSSHAAHDSTASVPQSLQTFRTVTLFRRAFLA